MAYLDENGLEYFWGKIKDRVSSAVAPKANDADVVHKTGDVTIDGVVTLQNTAEGHTAGDAVTDLVIRNPEVVRGIDGSGRSFTRVILADAEGDTEETFAGRLGLLEVVSPKENDTNREELRLHCYKYSDAPADYGKLAGFTVGYDINDIPYAIAPATSDERTNSKDIVTRGYMEASEWNWQKTKKNAFVQFNPVPESDLEPVVDFMFTETPPAENEKGPENPSTINGVSSVTIGCCGDNLFNVRGNLVLTSYFSITEDDFLELNVTNTASSTKSYGHYINASPVIQSDKTYTLVIEVQSISECTIAFNMNSGYSQRGQLNTGNYVDYTTAGTFFRTCSNNNLYNPNTMLRLMVNVGPGKSASVKMRVSVFEGTVNSSNFKYVPYAGNEYTIQLGDTYYGGSLDVATGVMTVAWAGESITSFSDVNAVYTNTINFTAYTNEGHYGAGLSVGNLVCNRFTTEYSDSDEEHCRFGGSSAQTRYAVQFFISKSRLDVSGAVNPSSPTNAEWVAAANAWLANNSIFVAFALYTPETIQLTPQQIRSIPALDKYEPRINTVYTDQEAVQVGYQRFFDENRLAAIEARLDALEGN